jgi:hypothetical protein
MKKEVMAIKVRLKGLKNRKKDAQSYRGLEND